MELAKTYPKKRKKKITAKDVVLTCLVYLELIVIAVIVLYPIMWILGTALSPTTGLADTRAIQTEPTLANFRRLFDETRFTTWYRNTFVIASITMVATVCVTTFTAFVFARLPFKGRKAGLLTIMVLQMFPVFLGMTAIYVIFLNLGLLDNIYSLVFIYVASSIPFNIWLVRGYMRNIPKSLDEAALMDGATKFQIFIYVIFPLSVPIVSFMAITAFIAPWMDFILPRLLLSRHENHTIALGLFDLAEVGNFNYDITAFAAACIIVGVPIAMLYMIFQRYLLVGLTAGANKGE